MVLKFEEAHDMKRKVIQLVYSLNLSHINVNSISCFRSKGSKTRAYARIWEFPRILQLALKQDPHYVIELINPKFDGLNEEEKEKVLIHELMHIPHNFSGSLRPHGNLLGKYLDRKIDDMHKKFRQQYL